jgi:hypothetical protein
MQVPAQNEEETTTSVACRPKQGRNKIPKGRSLITELDELGEPVAPVKVVEQSTHNLGVIHRSYRIVLIKHYNIFGVWTSFLSNITISLVYGLFVLISMY